MQTEEFCGAQFSAGEIKKTPKLQKQLRCRETELRLLGDVTRNELGHLEHAHRSFAIEHRFERGVGIDLGAFLFVLQSILANVFPELFGEFGPRQGLGADDGGELVIRLHRFHESCVWFAF